MDSTLRQMLDGFRYSLRNYGSSLGAANEKLQKASRLMDSLEAKAEGGADMTRIAMDPEFAQLAALLGELASEPPLPPEQVEADEDIPPASLPAAGYHMAFDALPPDVRQREKPYYDRIFALENRAENALHFNVLLAEDTVLLDMARIPLQEAAKNTLEQAKDAHSPTVDLQQRLAAEVYARVETLAELEFEGARMAELSNTEHPWDAAYLEVIGLLPACAQAIESFGPHDDSVSKLRNSHRFMQEFLGITWDDVFRDPRYLLFWNHVFWPRVPGEKRQRYGVSDPAGWRDLLKSRFYDPFVKNEPPPASDPEKTRVRFWGNEYPARQTLNLLNDPPRPDIAP